MLHGALYVLAVIAGICLLVIAVMTTVDVTVRWLTGVPITGVYEIAQILLLTMTCLGLPYLHLQGRELSVDILRARAKGRVRKSLDALDHVVTVGFFVLLAWTAWTDFSRAILGGFRAQGMLRIPTSIPLGLVLVGSILVILALLARALGLFKRDAS